MRFRSLDAVRGIAALIVLFHHAFLILSGAIEDRVALRAHGFAAPYGWVYLTPLRLLVAGPAAVFVFFVLSGFVLTLSLEADRQERYPGFLVKRVARIWLPFAVVVCGSAALAWAAADRPLPGGASAWMRLTWSQPPAMPMLIQHLAMTGTDVSLDSPIWSLVHEMRVSLVFPAIVWLARRWGRSTWLASLVLLLVAVEVQTAFPPGSFRRSLTGTLVYLPLFLMGISLALHRERIFGLLRSWRTGVRLLAWVGAVAGLAYAPVVTGSIERVHDAMLLLINGAAATVVVGLCSIDGRASRVLGGTLPQALGRISYSLYLVHVVVFAIVLRSLADVPLGLSIAAAMLAALLIG